MRKKIIALLLVAAASPTLVMAGDKHGSDCCPKGSHGHFEAGPKVQSVTLLAVQVSWALI